MPYQPIAEKKKLTYLRAFNRMKSPQLLLVTATIAVTLCLTNRLFSQTQLPPYKRDLTLVIDNDILNGTDKYYTAGQDISYRFIPKSSPRIFNNTDSSKTILAFQYGTKVFNPRNLDTKNVFEMDRPYCGWNFITASVLNFRRSYSGNSVSLQMGLVGPASGMDHVQRWLHQVVGLYPLEGWESQISNEFVINANVTHIHQFPIARSIDAVSTTSAWVGTGSNKLSQDITLRLLRFNPINQSAFTNSTVSKSSAPDSEFFLYVSLEGSYVLSNIFIEGSLFSGNPSPFTTSINPWLLTSKLGFQYSQHRISLGLAFIHLSKETEFVTSHDYMSLQMSYRF